MVLSDLSKVHNSGAFHSLSESLNLSATVNESMIGLDSFNRTTSVLYDTSEGCDLDHLDSLEDICLDAIKPSIQCTNIAEDDILSGICEIGGICIVRITNMRFLLEMVPFSIFTG